MTKTEILNKLDEYNDGIEDLYNYALHELENGDAENLNVKEFLESLLKGMEED